MDSPHPCYHCGLPVPADSPYYVDINGSNEAMCCPGCQAVAKTIIETGLTDYYQYRTTEASTANILDESLIEALRLYDRPDIQLDFVTQRSSGEAETVLIIEGITCAACSWLIEHQLLQLDGITAASVNLSNSRARILWNPEVIELSQILRAIYEIGYKAQPYYPAKQDAVIQAENRQYFKRLGIAGIAMMQVMMYAVALYAGAFEDMAETHRNFLRWISLLLTTPVVLYSAQPFFRAAWRNVRSRHLSMDLSVSLAIGAAYLASVWSTIIAGEEVYFDSVTMFTFFLLLGRFLEFRARLRLDQSSHTLNKLLPESVQLLIDGGQRTVALRDVKPGDHILVKTGQIIPADGYVMSGVSSVDESQLTGEFSAQKKAPEDKVIAGSYVMENPLQIRVTDVAGQTRLSAVLRLLDQARASKPPIAIMADHVAQYFIAGVLLVTATTAITWWLIDPDNAFWITLSVLVVTCPCALSLATPTALTAATGYLAKQGFIISHGHVLEGLSQATHIIFDKTGTLTRGALTISKLNCLSNLSREQCYQIAAAIEAHSEHPIARAFKPSKLSASDIKTVPGCGIEGVIEGELYRLGTPEYVLGLAEGDSPTSLAFEGNPSTQHVLLGSHHGALAWIELSDELRPNCANVVSELKTMDFQVELLSGDFSEHVHLIAKQLGISKALAKASPRDKMEYIQTLQRQGKKVVMIGDGINDIPVLANADISIAMTNASDLTKTTADAILLSGELNHLTEAIRCARKCKAIIRQNIGWAILYNLLALPLAAAGWVLPYLAAIGMSGSSLLVVMNALRLNNPGKRLPREISS